MSGLFRIAGTYVSVIASHITDKSNVCSTAYSGWQYGKHQTSTLLALCERFLQSSGDEENSTIHNNGNNPDTSLAHLRQQNVNQDYLLKLSPRSFFIIARNLSLPINYFSAYFRSILSYFYPSQVIFSRNLYRIFWPLSTSCIASQIGHVALTLLGLLSWSPTFMPNCCNSFGGQVPVDQRVADL